MVELQTVSSKNALKKIQKMYLSSQYLKLYNYICTGKQSVHIRPFIDADPAHPDTLPDGDLELARRHEHFAF